MSKKFIDLTQLTTPATGDILPIHDASAGSTKYITLADLMTMASSIPNNAITGAMLSTTAITLGYTQITSNVGSLTSATGQLVTGLTATVTIPAGGRRVKITASTYNSVNGAANIIHQLQIWRGTVGSGTQLNAVQERTDANSETGYMTVIASEVPSAGSVTYNVGFLVGSGTATVGAAASAPAFILVEAI